MAVTPFDHTFGLQVDGSVDRVVSAAVAVPVGKVLVIRFVSGSFLFETGQTHIALVSLLYQGSPDEVQHEFIPVRIGTMGLQDVIVVAQHTHLLVGSGVGVQAAVIRDPINGEVNGRVTISGELVDV